MKKDNDVIDIVVGTPEESLWQKVKEAAEARIKQNEEALIVEKELLKIANHKTRNLHLTNGKRKS